MKGADSFMLHFEQRQTELRTNWTNPRIKTFQTTFEIWPVECASFHRDPIQARLGLLAAYHTVAFEGSIGFVCLKIHFIDAVGERSWHKSIGPNSLLLILFISNLLQKNWKTGELDGQTLAG